MGFMDKLKNAASAAGSVAKSAVLAVAQGYGVVAEGKYKGCKVGFTGSELGSAELVFHSVVGLKSTEEGRLNIKEDITDFSFEVVELDTPLLTITFGDGESSVIKLEKDNSSNGANKPVKTLEEEYAKLEEEYAKMAKLLTCMVASVSYFSVETAEHIKTLDHINIIMRYAGQPEI